jgi:hypothetical protein
VVGVVGVVGQPVDRARERVEGGDGGGERAALPGRQRRERQVEHGRVGGLPGQHRLAARFGHRQLDRAPVARGGDPVEHPARAERVDDRGDGVRPHVQQPGELSRTRPGMFG